ncbi:uncharacterized protein L203_100348 [Cryptococcus depauperatus CBS 7841]|uniref:Uncharacterized protein n=1 Tax=Cryptococcus depauperatus CBS 7841 TaxID=1295531 RepID=A0A1E3HY47_9TREE|nr:hypothetical protein L203_05779 [Cryptococcus depauperatus CBS 7841]
MSANMIKKTFAGTGHLARQFNIHLGVQTRNYRSQRSSPTDWPWRTIPSSPNTILLEKTVYARPSETNPLLLTIISGLWGFFVFSWWMLPKPKKKEPTDEEKAKMAEKYERSTPIVQTGLTVAKYVSPNAQFILMGSVTVLLAGALVAANRIVTRLTIYQLRPMTGNGGAKTFLRLTTIGNQMTMGLKKPRELKIEDCDLYFPNSERATTVRLHLPNSRKPFDVFPYNLDFRQSKDDYKAPAQGIEWVLSMQRLQEIFGVVRRGKLSNRKKMPS